jgi:hypothetical protein
MITIMIMMMRTTIRMTRMMIMIKLKKRRTVMEKKNSKMTLTE